MKKNEIRFIATEQGINCEGNVTLCVFDREKAEKNLSKVQQAANDCGASLSLSPTGIQLGFNVGLSPDTKCINEADARMKCIIEQVKDFIHNMNDTHEDVEAAPGNEAIAEHQYEIIKDMFDSMHERYPKAKLAFVCDDENQTCVAGNMDPMHAFACLMGALINKEDGKNK